jgi:hypothetical protein
MFVIVTQKDYLELEGLEYGEVENQFIGLMRLLGVVLPRVS